MNDDDQNFPPVQINVSAAETAGLQRFPRIFYWDGTSLATRTKGQSIEYPMTRVENISNSSNYGGGDPFYQEFEREWFTKCQPVEKILVRPTCNSLHELP